MLQGVRLPFFRNHAGLHLQDLPRHVMLCGANGAGKTNLIEAISLFGQSKGFRNAALEDLCPIEEPERGFAVRLELAPNPDNPDNADNPAQKVHAELATLFVPRVRCAQADKGARRRLLFNDEDIPQQAVQQHLRLCWLLPQMGSFFADGVKTRRAWLDRIVTKNDPEHDRRLARHRVLVKERLAVLSSYSHETAWLEQLEQKIAACAVALTASRGDTLSSLNAILAEHVLLAEFPLLRLAQESKIADELARYDALTAESKLQERLQDARAQDRTEQRSREGAHRARIAIENLSLFANPIAAEMCSCGEQKSMLLALLVAEALLLMGTAQRKPAPVLLLDDFPAHLDALQQKKALRVLAQLQTQCFYTTTAPVEGAQEALCAKGFLLESLEARKTRKAPSPLAKPSFKSPPAMSSLRSNAA